MDNTQFNLLIREWKAGELEKYSISDLRKFSSGCVVYIQNLIRPAPDLKQAIDDEIRRKEASEAKRQSDVAARQMHDEAIAASRYANRLSWTAIGIAFVALAFQVAPVLFGSHASATSTSQPESTALPTPQTTQHTATIVVPSQSTNAISTTALPASPISQP